jgi:hypothetical protein
MTRLKRILAFSGASRTQPWEAGVPNRRMAWLPWMACPESVKMIECGIGASSYSFE